MWQVLATWVTFPFRRVLVQPQAQQILNAAQARSTRSWPLTSPFTFRDK